MYLDTDLVGWFHPPLEDKMSEKAKDSLKNELDKRRSAGNYRSLRSPATELIDFSSNDYLGLAQNARLKEEITRRYTSCLNTRNGATGSRLMTGTTDFIMETERQLAGHFASESGLIFSSGYMANLGFFSSVLQKGDTLLYDELSHACIKDGARLSNAQKFPFRHNDLNQLESKLKRATGQAYIACESVYSMDGDFAPLPELAGLAARYKARLVVDEAHSTGIFGNRGNGLVNQWGLSYQVFATLYTFGKALGVHGAFIAGSKTLCEYLINFSRPFIYTTAPCDFEVMAMAASVNSLKKEPELIRQLHERIGLFKKLISPKVNLIASKSAIQALLIPGNEKVKRAGQHLADRGFDIRPVLSPTVKKGWERLRICLHTFNTEEQITQLASMLNDYLLGEPPAL